MDQHIAALKRYIAQIERGIDKRICAAFIEGGRPHVESKETGGGIESLALEGP